MGLERASDLEIWDYAEEHDFTILSKDADFSHLAFLRGPPPKVVWLRVGNASTRRISDVIRHGHGAIREFSASDSAAILVLP
ncbi:MAG: DUF5615 family PIN-like protein [Planctomycetota bacterium]